MKIMRILNLDYLFLETATRYYGKLYVEIFLSGKYI